MLRVLLNTRLHEMLFAPRDGAGEGNGVRRVLRALRLSAFSHLAPLAAAL